MTIALLIRMHIVLSILGMHMCEISVPRLVMLLHSSIEGPVLRLSALTKC